MLAIDRYAGEGVWIGDEIFVHVRRVGDRKVRLQFSAPPGMPVLREELRPDLEGRANAIVGPGRYDYGRPKPRRSGAPTPPPTPAKSRKKRRRRRNRKSRPAPTAPVTIAPETVVDDAA